MQVAVGTASPGSYGTQIIIASQGSNAANTFRFFSDVSGTKSFLFEYSIPKNDSLVYVNGILNPAQTRTIDYYVPLPSASYKLYVNMEVAGNYDITLKGKSYV